MSEIQAVSFNRSTPALLEKARSASRIKVRNEMSKWSDLDIDQLVRKQDVISCINDFAKKECAIIGTTNVKCPLAKAASTHPVSALVTSYTALLKNKSSAKTFLMYRLDVWEDVTKNISSYSTFYNVLAESNTLDKLPDIDRINDEITKLENDCIELYVDGSDPRNVLGKLKEAVKRRYFIYDQIMRKTKESFAEALMWHGFDKDIKGDGWAADFKGKQIIKEILAGIFISKNEHGLAAIALDENIGVGEIALTCYNLDKTNNLWNKIEANWLCVNKYVDDLEHDVQLKKLMDEQKVWEVRLDFANEMKMSKFIESASNWLDYTNMLIGMRIEQLEVEAKNEIPFLILGNEIIVAKLVKMPYKFILSQVWRSCRRKFWNIVTFAKKKV